MKAYIPAGSSVKINGVDVELAQDTIVVFSEDTQAHCVESAAQAAGFQLVVTKEPDETREPNTVAEVAEPEAIEPAESEVTEPEAENEVK